MEFNDSTYEIIGCAMRVHTSLGPGLREKPYENALIIELRHEGFRVESQRPYPIWYREQPVGECIPDMTVNSTVLVDAKSIDGLGENEQAQMLNYLRISGISIGLVINFKNQKLEWRRIVHSKG